MDTVSCHPDGEMGDFSFNAFENVKKGLQQVAEGMMKGR